MFPIQPPCIHFQAVKTAGGYYRVCVRQLRRLNLHCRKHVDLIAIG
jgi:hypothetical protein